MDIDAWDNSELVAWLAKEGFSGVCVLTCREFGITGGSFKTLTQDEFVNTFQVDKKEAKKIIQRRDKLLKNINKPAGWLKSRLLLKKSKQPSAVDLYAKSKTPGLTQPQTLKSSQSEMIVARPSVNRTSSFSELLRHHKPSDMNSNGSPSHSPSSNPNPPTPNSNPNPNPNPNPSTSPVVKDKEATQEGDAECAPEWKAFLEKTAVMNVRREAESGKQNTPRVTENKIFGVPLEMILSRQKVLYPKVQVPLFVDSAVQYIMKYGLKERDIFKALVPYTKVKDTKAKIDAGNGIDVNFTELLKYIDAGMVAELLKEYIRDLPSPLVPPKLLIDLQDALNQNSDEMRKVLQLLPVPNYNVIEKLMCLLRAVSRNNVDNGMDAERLSDIFGPILFAMSMIHEDEGIDLVCAWIEGYTILFPQRQGGSSLAVAHAPPITRSNSSSSLVPKSDSVVPTTRSGSSLSLKKPLDMLPLAQPQGMSKSHSEYLMGGKISFMRETSTRTDSF